MKSIGKHENNANIDINYAIQMFVAQKNKLSIKSNKRFE
jgi:hypothetical protein